MLSSASSCFPFWAVVTVVAVGDINKHLAGAFSLFSSSLLLLLFSLSSFSSRTHEQTSNKRFTTIQRLHPLLKIQTALFVNITVAISLYFTPISRLFLSSRPSSSSSITRCLFTAISLYVTSCFSLLWTHLILRSISLSSSSQSLSPSSLPIFKSCTLYSVLTSSTYRKTALLQVLLLLSHSCILLAPVLKKSYLHQQEIPRLSHIASTKLPTPSQNAPCSFLRLSSHTRDLLQQAI